MEDTSHFTGGQGERDLNQQPQEGPQNALSRTRLSKKVSFGPCFFRGLAILEIAAIAGCQGRQTSAPAAPPEVLPAAKPVEPPLATAAVARTEIKQVRVVWKESLCIERDDHPSVAIREQVMRAISRAGLTAVPDAEPYHATLRMSYFETLTMVFGGGVSGIAGPSLSFTVELKTAPEETVFQATADASESYFNPIGGDKLIESHRHCGDELLADVHVKYLGPLLADALMDKPDPARVLIEALRDPNGDTRRSAITALEQSPDPRAAQPLLALLQDSFQPVRVHAARLLGKIGDARSLPALSRSAAEDSDEYVRSDAKMAIEQIRQNKP